MPPKKRSRTAASSSTASRPKTKEAILASYKVRPLVPERGMTVPDWFEEYIRLYNWPLFVKADHIGDGVRSWVFEFYTHLEMTRSDQVNVQGKTVDISPDAINKFFKLRITGEDQYSALVTSEINTEAVLVELTGRNPELPSNWPNFPKKWLDHRARFLNLWLCARLFPATSHSSLSRRRALLIYAMSRGQSINVGRLINDEMRAAMTPKKSNQGLGFPSLITALCRKAGLRVPKDPAEVIKLMSNVLWKPPVQGEAEQEDEQDQAEQAEAQPQDHAPEGQQEAHSEASTSSFFSARTQYNKDMDKLFDNVTDMMAQLNVIVKNQKRMEERQLRLEVEENRHHEEVRRGLDEISDFMRYQAAVNAYMFSGQQGDPPAYPLPRPLPPPDRP